MKLTSFIFLFEKQPIFDIIVFNYFNYLYVGLKEIVIFTKREKKKKKNEDIFVKIRQK